LGISKKKGFMDMELKSSAWKKVVEEFTAPPLMLKTTIITSDGYKDALLDYIERNDPEMVIIPKRILENGMKKIVNKGKQSKIVRAFSRPVLLY
jgi:hypothetical protein